MQNDNFFDIFGVPRGPLGPSWDSNEREGAENTFWRRFLLPSWAPGNSQKGAKMDLFLVKIASLFVLSFEPIFTAILDPFSAMLDPENCPK